MTDARQELVVLAHRLMKAPIPRAPLRNAEG